MPLYNKGWECAEEGTADKLRTALCAEQSTELVTQSNGTSCIFRPVTFPHSLHSYQHSMSAQRERHL